MKPTPATRYEMSQTEATVIHRYYQTLPEPERVEIGAMAQQLADDIKNLGPASAVAVVWALGRLMQREGLG